MTKTLSTYIVAFDYFDKNLLVLLPAGGSVSVALFSTVIVAPVGILSKSLNLVFSISNGIAKNF